MNIANEGQGLANGHQKDVWSLGGGCWWKQQPSKQEDLLKRLASLVTKKMLGLFSVHGFVNRQLSKQVQWTDLHMATNLANWSERMLKQDFEIH